MGHLMHILMDDQLRIRNESTLRACESARIDPPDEPDDSELAEALASAEVDIDWANIYLDRAASERDPEARNDAITAAERSATSAAMAILGDRVDALIAAALDLSWRFAPETEGDRRAVAEARRAAHALGAKL